MLLADTTYCNTSEGRQHVVRNFGIPVSRAASLFSANNQLSLCQKYARSRGQAIGKGNTNPIMPKYGRKSLNSLDALSVTAWLLRTTVKHTIKHPQKALHCVLIVKREFCVSSAMKRVAMIKTANLSARLQYHVDFGLSQRILIMQRLQWHFAILFCITQGILAVGNDPLDCCIENGAQQCRVANHMSTLLTGMSLLTYMIEVLVRRLANHIQSGNTTPWHAYCITLIGL